MALPSLHSELVCLHELQDILQKRLDVERAYISSLAAWRTVAFESGPQPLHALGDVFLSLVVATDEDIQSRRAMEATLQSQVDAVFAATEELRGYFEHTMARSEQLQKYDELARKALEQRKLRHDEWKTWKSDLIASAGLLRLKPKPRNSPMPNDTYMAAAYDHADMEVRKCMSKAEVARFTFKDKAVEEVDPISLAYQVVIDAIAKCLRRFAENQQECASTASVGAGRIVKVASNISGLRIAGVFHGALMSEAQDIPTYSTPYVDLEALSRYPHIQSQPIIMGFSLPPPYLSSTASTGIVVDVFCQLVSFIRDCQAWDKYITASTPIDNARVRKFCDFELSWTRSEDLNRDLLRSLGPSTCADLVKALLASFPEPLMGCSDVLADRLRLLDPEVGRRPDNLWAGPPNQNDAIALVPLVEPIHNRPQGKMLRALCESLMPVFRAGSQIPRELIGGVFSEMLTRKGDRLKYAFPILVKKFPTIVTIIDNRNAPTPTTRSFPISDLLMQKAEPPPPSYALDASTSQPSPGDDPVMSLLRQNIASPGTTPLNRDRSLPNLPAGESNPPSTSDEKANFWREFE